MLTQSFDLSFVHLPLRQNVRNLEQETTKLIFYRHIYRNRKYKQYQN